MQLIVLLQILIIWALVIWVYKLVARRDGRVPIDDIGMLWLMIFMLYATLPPLFWLIQGGTYGPFSGRLFILQPNVQEVQYLMNISLSYIFGFTFVFLNFYKRVNHPHPKAQAHISQSIFTSCVILILVAQLTLVFLKWSGIRRPAESYADSYAATSELPLFIRQYIKMILGISGIATQVLIIAIFQTWPKYKSLFIFYIFILIISFDPKGSRGTLVVSFLSMLVAWHVLIRPLPQKQIFVGGFLGLLIFLAFGVWRQLSSLSDIGTLEFEAFGVGEFDALWGNAVELLQAKKNGLINVNFETRFGEFFAFVPSQILWFEKITLNDWYLSEFYPGLKETGMGFVFGAISQAVFGGGLFEATIRGACIGAIAVSFMIWVRTPTTSWWRFPLHIYILIGIFSGIRETTFIQFGDLVQTWLIAPFVIAIIGASLSKRSARNIENEKKIC
jgi:hypothetical protein